MDMEFGKGSQIVTTSKRIFVVENVHVTSDGKTLDYELQEFDATGNEIGKPAWYNSEQLKITQGGRYELKLNFKDKTEQYLLDAFRLIDEAVVSVPSGIAEYEAICRVHEMLEAMIGFKAKKDTDK